MKDLINNISSLRIAVAYLGEKDQGNWWTSSFLSSSGGTFLNPVFPKSSQLARAQGASQAACNVHDDAIGIGNVFHLFRLPENIEQNINDHIIKNEDIFRYIESRDEAEKTLSSLASEGGVSGIGPFQFDSVSVDDSLIASFAAAYSVGFKNDQPVYPFYRGSL